MKIDEIAEAEAIHREDALARIGAMIRRYNFTPSEMLSLFSRHGEAGDGGVSRCNSKPFGPFFPAR
jgi:hypothetical protein